MSCIVHAVRLGVPSHNADSFLIGSMEVPRDDAALRRMRDEQDLKEMAKQKKKHDGRALSPPCILSLDDEFKQLKGGEEEGEGGEKGERDEETLLEDLVEERSEDGHGEDEGEIEGEGGEGMYGIDEEELRLQEDMFAVKMEVEMMQKEKESWEEERKTLEHDKANARADREALER